jgi:glycosidase
MTCSPARWRRSLAALFGCLLLCGGQPPDARGEVILQYFNTSWLEIAQKMPEIVEAGYSALWLPPPTKASGGLSVGYDLWDPFDLGSKDQRNTVRTRYGTEAELLHMIEVAHRFGVRVYFDNIMNHRAFDIPGFNENTPIDIYPGMLPEDFHLRVTEEGFYRKWDNTRNWQDEWQVQHLGLADLIDIAQEGPNNANFGPTEGSTHPKLTFVRDLDRPWQYDRLPNGDYVGFGPDNGITRELVEANPNFYKEDVGAYLRRAVRWLMDRTKADGLRLDAVKHVPSDFFGRQSGADKDASDAGYLGAAQWQFNITRGYSDWDNHRDSVFNSDQGRDDALMFGEHLGTPPGYQQYIDAGMRLVDAPLHREMNNRLGNPSSGLGGLDAPGWSGDPSFNDSTGIPFAQSHDDDYANRRELQHAYYLTRRGIPNVYTDGYYKAATLGESGGAFPRHANNPFLGQFGDKRLPNLLEIHEAFARGAQIPRWSDADVVAYERRDKRENPAMSDADGTVLLFMMNDNYASQLRRPIGTSFPAVDGGANAYLYNYSTYSLSNGGSYVWASQIASGQIDIPPGGYFAFSWKNPDPSNLWAPGGGSPLVIRQNGQPVESLRVTRRDGPDGDRNFNPYNLPNRGYPEGVTPEPFTYQMELPRVTDATNLRFLLFADGSTKNVHMKLNGGIDINSQMGMGPQTGDLRDNPPALSTDTFLGYEQARFVQRQHPEKFAARDSTRCTIGSASAETYAKVIGSGDFNVVDGPTGANADFNTFNGTTASFLYHNPSAPVEGDNPADPGVGDPQYSEGANSLTVWAKTNGVGAGYRMYFYYTTDGTNPEGAGGFGIGTTQVAEMNYRHNDDDGTNDWWGSTTIPKPAAGTELRYKIGIFRDRDASFAVGSVWPGWQGDIDRKLRMMTVFEVDGFNGTTVSYRPHNDYGATRVGLPDGWHVLRGRAYLDRDGRAAIYKTFTQPFYLDTETPRGEVKFPASDGEQVGGQEYGLVVRTDLTVTEVWYHIADSNPNNDDGATKVWNGNGNGGEPFTDTNRNGRWDPGEPFEDINGNGVYDNNIGESWAKAVRVTSSPAIDSGLPAEWRFSYRQIPSSGAAAIRIRLVEASSSPRIHWTQDMTDAAGHFTTLTRNVQTRGPETRFFIAWPQNNGDVVGPGYGMKVYFSPSLREGLSDAQVIESFTIRLQNQESGRTGGGVAQSRDGYQVGFENGFQTLAFNLPNMFNGQPDWLHGIEAVFARAGVAPYTTDRLVRAFPVPPPPLVDILNPQEIGSDGRRIELILPDLADPAPSDRRLPVLVKTDGPVETVTLGVEFEVAPGNFGGSLTLRAPTPDDPNPRIEGGAVFHAFDWNDVVEGQYRLRATVDKDGQSNTTRRNATVLFRQMVDLDESGDSDNDGLTDSIETTKVPLPPGRDEDWTNGDVHLHLISGRTDPRRPQSDGSRLPDGLQLGLSGPLGPSNNGPDAEGNPRPGTDLTADSNGDGFPNFLPDLDPPVFNTFDSRGYDQRLSRTDLIGGSMTDPSKPDTDEDGLDDHEEDLNRNGRVDIGILGAGGKVTEIIKHPNIPTTRNSSAVNRAALPANARFLETDPNNRDTIGDGLTDGQSDANRNGRVDIFLLQADGARVPVMYTDRNSPHFKYNLIANDNAVILTDDRPAQAIRSRAVDYAVLFADYNAAGTGALQTNGWPKLLITETDPLVLDTIGDGFHDGWKAQYGLDPLDNGVYNFRTGEPGNPDNRPEADLTGDGVTNAQHYLAGTDPRSTLNPGTPGGSNRITIGPGPAIGTINGVTYFEEFSDWTFDDLVVLDEYEGDGNNNQGGDLFPAFDQWDSSRDIVAFYARDGGDPAAGGDDRVYFRLDFDDLRALAENGHLNIYVAINHTPGTGERVLPDEVDTLTEMRWRAVVAVYNGAEGRVYVDTDPAANTNNFGEDLFSGKGVVVYDQAHPKGFKGAYFNSELDAVEFSVSRQALRDSGWAGSDFKQLNFQVYTTKDGTRNSPAPGPGDIGGRSDLRDTIYDDRVVEHAFFAQSGREDILRSWFNTASRPAANRRAKLMLVAEENQHLRGGGWIQDRINDGAGAGYHRLIRAHEVFGAPLTLAITPTLASSIQWASADPARNRPFRDGPSFNQSIADLGQAGLLELASTTFGGHILAYTTADFDRDNIELASRWLENIYGLAPSESVLYLAERTLSGAILDRVRDLGFGMTFADQREHIEGWFGRTQALGDNGYRLNRVNGVDLIVISDSLENFRANNTDRGAPIQIRRILNRKARSGEQQQVVVLLGSLEEFRTLPRADNYDRNVRWYANRPWIEIVKPSDLGDRNWSAVDRGAGARPLRAKNFVQYAALGSYDNWYFGLPGLREGLAGKKFQNRPGREIPAAFGRIGDEGVSHSTWQAVAGLSAENPLGRLARGVMGGGLFTTAFHNQRQVDLAKYSNGQYINPPLEPENLAAFAAIAQANLRHAAIYARVMEWATGGNDPSLRVAEAADIDLDGENEYLLYNNRVFAVFEALGGRLTGAWLRDPATGRVWQVAGNHLSYSGFADEREGGSAADANRTSGFKDWLARTNAGAEATQADDLYTVTPIPNGFRFVSGGVAKNIALPEGDAGRLEARYTLTGLEKLLVRFGLSPNLEDLLLNGQAHLGNEIVEGNRRVELVNDNGEDNVRAYVQGSQFTLHNESAVDVPDAALADSTTLRRRNQAQTHQVEFELIGSGEEHLIVLGFDQRDSDLPADPFVDYMSTFFPDGTDEAIVGPGADPDGDGWTNYEEFLFGTDPTIRTGRDPLATTIEPVGEAFEVTFDTKAGRVYRIRYSTDLTGWSDLPGAEFAGDGNRRTHRDPVEAVARRFYRIEVGLPE